MKVLPRVTNKVKKKSWNFHLELSNAELMAHRTLAQNFLHLDTMDFAGCNDDAQPHGASVLQLPI